MAVESRGHRKTVAILEKGRAKQKVEESIGGVSMREKVETVLNQIRPALVADGGNVELVDVSKGVVTLRLTGACSGCPMAVMTLRQGIEQVLKEQVPEVEEVVAV